MTAVLSTKASAPATRPLVLVLLILSFAMPFYFFLGGLKLNGYRVILILFLFPAIFGWLSGKAGKIRAIDFLVIGFCLWACLTLAVNHGFGPTWQFIGMFMIETLVPYFIARTYIRNMESFRHFVKWLFLLLLVLLPFAAFEAVTGRTPLLDLFGKVMSVYQKWVFEPRLGLLRAQTTMPHPILYGVFCAPAFALTWYVLGWNKSLFKRAGLTSIVGGAVFCSLSSGAFMNVILQVMLMGWNWVFRFLENRWKILLSIFGVLYFIGEVGSNRNMFQIFATHFTLTPGTAWARINIFTFVSDDILRNPLFGIGLHDWTRPAWMWALSTVDNFWLLMALRHGFPGLILLVAAVVTIFFQVGNKTLSGAAADARLGYLFSLFGICLSAITVHLWDSTYCFFMFLLGAGIWFLDVDDQAEQDGGEKQASTQGRTVQYTRFPRSQSDPASPGRPVRSANR